MNNAQLNNPQARALSQSQKPRITDEDCTALKPFKDNEELVLAVRNLFLGFDLSEEERYIIKNQFDNDEVNRVVKKMFLPQLESKIPVGQNMDLWMTNEIASSDKENFELNYKVKSLLIEMIETSFEKLADLDDFGKKGVDLSPKKDLAFLRARIGYINHTTMVLQDIIMNAHRSSELSDDNKFKNSNK